jgi:hypothetical protein
MLRRPVSSHLSLASWFRRSFSAASASPASTRRSRDLSATSISAKPDFTLTSSAKLIEAEQTYSAHNYHPLPVVFSRAQGVHVWDPEGKRYFDFLSAYSSVNQGHSHPAIVAAAVKQMQVYRPACLRVLWAYVEAGCELEQSRISQRRVPRVQQVQRTV